jgi:shikimate kinase
MKNQERKNIFLLGRPGCGKSELYRRFTQAFKDLGLARDFIRIDDFPKLWDIFSNDKSFKRCRPTEDGGYKVTDPEVWDDILKEVNTDVKKLSKPGRIIFIEFSRPNYVHSLKNFDKTILDNSLIVYIDCSFETCWMRNVRRHKAALAAGMDNHLVSREEMEKTYLHDDRDSLLEFGKESAIPVVTVKTDYEGTAHYKGIVEKVTKAVEELVKK